ncbi:hypothetical protein F4827_003531 [Paraburkholderia bannensis]|uniref:Uncharacterized protein n=1 Tax=Paraburkholderia bannensis TaxID=765414 RepID=A0A7W9WTT8_9BURK|nr:hypothetical protein [Paraburkholderia sp. WP4_3_2]MBB6103676.1 hypothetical protein [Paraburkholderia bannensis]
MPGLVSFDLSGKLIGRRSARQANLSSPVMPGGTRHRCRMLNRTVFPSAASVLLEVSDPSNFSLESPAFVLWIANIPATSNRETAVRLRIVIHFLATLAACLSGSAQSHTSVVVGVGIPPPVMMAPVPMFYAAPSPVVAQSIQSPPTTAYVEKAQESPAVASWWYCPATKQYYPYVKGCSSDWVEVPAKPAGTK